MASCFLQLESAAFPRLEQHRQPDSSDFEWLVEACLACPYMLCFAQRIVFLVPTQDSSDFPFLV